MILNASQRLHVLNDNPTWFEKILKGIFPDKLEEPFNAQQ